MNRITTQSIFTSASSSPFSWRSYLTSGLVHALLIALVLSITFPTIQEVTKRRESVTLISPQLPTYRSKPLPQPRTRPQLVLPKTPAPKPIVQVRPQLSKPPEIEPPLPETRPQKDMALNAPVQPPPEPKVNVPKPEIHTGAFETGELAKGPEGPKPLKIGGFGDPRGLPDSPTAHAPSLIAKVGSFDLPAGDGKGGGNGTGQTGVRQTSFGSIGGAGTPAQSSGTGGSVHTGGFADSFAVASAHHGPVSVAKPITTPVEILFKPKPVYSDEARSLKLEGRVSLEVVFLANGSIRIVGVLHGLGHGLDQAAET
ncbi:MAG: energy transducer TonB, partial [Acidobacteriaceae bacterium]|nr:energy transducer TonB [Acidobacteriaceae bacterium]